MPEEPMWTPQRHRDTAWSREVVLDVEQHPTKDYITPDGRRFADARITLTAEAAERMWQGYMCAHCLEPFQEANPDRCNVCGFPVKEMQRKLLERDFLGHDPTVVSGFPMDRELEHLETMSIPKKRK